MNLTDEELVILDGKCLFATQIAVDAAKTRLEMAKTLGIDPKLAGFVADAVTEAKTNGQLICCHVNLRSCKICGTHAGYGSYKRSSRNHRAGQPDYNRPGSISGKELAHRFITMSGYAALGCCNACFEKAKPLLKVALSTVRAEISDGITDVASRFRKFKNAHCKRCGWEGHEGQMGPLRTLMGDSFYPGKCPKCGAENRFLGPTIIETVIDKFTIVESAKT